MRSSLTIIVLILTSWMLPAAQAGAPTVVKVDPPSWFVGHSLDEVQLLIRGQGLDGATLSSDTPSVTVLRQQTNASGTYVIAYVSIDASAAPGPVSLRLGDTPVPFELVPKLTTTGRFQGLDSDDVVYLLMPDRFADGDATNNNPPGSEGNYDRGNPVAYHGGDFKGIKDRLPYLDDLGVTAIWLNPWYDNHDGGRDFHGYHAVDFYESEEHFGTVEQLRELVDAAHLLGIRVVQDQVVNHTGPLHPWVSDPPTPTWFNGTPSNHLTNDFDIPAIVNPDASPLDRRQVLEGWFPPGLPDLNQEDPEVARYLIQNELWWIGTTGIDAVRADTLPYVPREFWAELVTAVNSEYPDFFFAGEVFHTSPAITSFFQGGQTQWDGVDSRIHGIFDFPFWDRVRMVVGSASDASLFAGLLQADSSYPRPEHLLPFIANHDLPRAATTFLDTKRLKLANTLLLTSRGIPQLYYGDEIAMKGAADPANRGDFPGGFPGDKRDAFTELGRKKKQQDVFQHVQLLIHSRTVHAALQGPDTNVLLADGSQLAYVRSTGNENVMVLANTSEKKKRFTLDVSAYFREGTLLLDETGGSGTGVTRVTGGFASVVVPRLTAAVLVPDRSTP